MKSTNQNEVKDGEECKPVHPVSPCLQPSYASVLSRHEDSYPINNRVIKNSLENAEDVQFALTDASPCLIYKQQGSNTEKSGPIKVLKEGSSEEEYDGKYIKACKAIKFTWHHETGEPLLSIQNGKCRFLTPIALRTRARINL